MADTPLPARSLVSGYDPAVLPSLPQRVLPRMTFAMVNGQMVPMPVGDDTGGADDSDPAAPPKPPALVDVSGPQPAQPPVVPGPRSVMGMVSGLTAAPTGAALGSLVDKPGDLASAGRAAWEAFKGVPQTIFQTPEQQQQSLTSPSKELEKRGVDVPTLPGMMADLTLDPVNAVGGNPATDLGKLGTLGAMAVPDVLKGGKALVKGATGLVREAPEMERVLEALRQRWPNMAKAFGKSAEVPLQISGQNRSFSKALDRVATSIYDTTLQHGGATIHPLTGETQIPKDSTGFMVGKYSNQSGETGVVPLSQFSVQDIRAFMEKHAEAFAQDPDLAVGAWVDRDTDPSKPMVYLDVSQRKDTVRQATVAGARQRQPAVDAVLGTSVERDPATGKWPLAQKFVYDLKAGKDRPVANAAEFLQSPQMQQRLDEMYDVGSKVMNGKQWWDLYGSSLERVYGKERVAPLAAFLASTSGGSTPVHNMRAASEYLRRLIKEEPIIQPGFRIPSTSTGGIPGPLGGFNGPGMQMPMEAARVGNLQKAEAGARAATPEAAYGHYRTIQEDKMNDMFHSLTGMDIGVYDRHYAKVGEDWDKGVYMESTKDKLAGSMVKGQPSTYAWMENAVRDGAKRRGIPLAQYSSYVWEGIRDTIKRTGELYGMKHSASALPELTGGFPDLFDMLVEQKAKAWGISVPEMEQRLRGGNAELLMALLATPVGMAAYQQWQSAQGGAAGQQ